MIVSYRSNELSSASRRYVCWRYYAGTAETCLPQCTTTPRALVDGKVGGIHRSLGVPKIIVNGGDQMQPLGLHSDSDMVCGNAGR